MPPYKVGGVRLGRELPPSLSSRLLFSYKVTTINFSVNCICSRSVAMTKTTPLGVRLEPDVREALTRAAKDDARSISSLIAKIIADWLRERGYLPKP